MLKEKLKSVRVRLFLTLCVVVIALVICLIAVNSLVLENFYIYSKTNTIKELYNKINDYYEEPNLDISLETELKKVAFRNNFDILIKADTDLILFSTNKDFLSNITAVESKTKTPFEERKNLLYSDEKMTIRKIDDTSNSLNYILLYGKLDNGYSLYIRIPIAPIEESVRISNTTLVTIGVITILISAFAASVISRKFTKPILQLNDITKKMAKLDFEQKYRINDSDDEINELGRNINTMSDKLEATIKQLRETNSELEKDIEEKSKIDEMRKQFISDVSHELKTPIALIQGYSEGLLENVNTDDESRKFYAEVILDESNKMDVLVKQLLELMKLEYGKREFTDEKFDVVELINEVIRKCNVMLEENHIQVIFNEKEPIYAYADDFYIEQVMTNYFTNAIKHAKEVNGEKQIKITIQNVNDKIKFLNEVANILSKIENNMEREVYIDKISLEYKVSKEAIYAEVNKKLYGNSQTEKKLERPVTTIREVKQDVAEKEVDEKTKKTESLIIYLLINYPDKSFVRLESIVKNNLIKMEKNKLIINKLYEEHGKGNINIESIIDLFEDENIVNYLSGIMSSNFEITDVDKCIDDVILTYKKEILLKKRNDIMNKLNSQNTITKDEVANLEEELNSVIIQLAKIK